MSRLGRSQPIQPFATHGFLGNTPANGVLPQRPVVVERERRRESAPVAISVNGLYAVQVQVTATPPNPVVVAPADRRRAGLDPIALSAAGTVNSGVGVPGTTPPGPFVVSLDERRRFLAALPATSIHGYDAVAPPDATVVEPVRNRPRTPDPLQFSGVLAPSQPPLTLPPGPVVVLGDDARLRRVRLDPVVLRGSLAVFVPPPPIVPMAIYHTYTDGGGNTLATSGGAPALVTDGGASTLVTVGGTPTINTDGGTPTIRTEGAG